jgi:hypothetical protein
MEREKKQLENLSFGEPYVTIPNGRIVQITYSKNRDSHFSRRSIKNGKLETLLFPMTFNPNVKNIRRNNHEKNS